MNRIKSFAALSVALVSLWAANPTQGAATSVRRALGTVVPNVSLDNVTINDAIDFLRDVSGANIHVNWRALEGVGIGKDTQVNVKLRGVSLRKVLDLVLNEAGAGTGLTYYIDQGVIEVTTRELADKDLFTKVYPVADLIVEVPDFVGPDLNITSSNTGGSSSGGQGGGGGSSGGTLFSGSSGGGSGSGGTSGRIDAPMTRQERADALVGIITSVIQPEIWQANGGPAAIRFFNGSLIVTAPRSVHESLGGAVD